MEVQNLKKVGGKEDGKFIGVTVDIPNFIKQDLLRHLQAWDNDGNLPRSDLVIRARSKVRQVFIIYYLFYD